MRRPRAWFGEYNRFPTKTNSSGALNDDIDIPRRSPHAGGRTARAFLVGGLLASSGTALAQDNEDCPLGADLLLVNGRIHTMDARDTIVSTVQIIGNRFAAVGGRPRSTPCTQRVDLQGRTVIPGIIDNHNHIVLLGLRPGHDTRLENAHSIAAALETLAAKAATLPDGEWITSIGGFDINQFVAPPAPPRFPTLTELDSVTPDHPVYIQQSFSGPSVTNSLGKRFFESRGVEVAADGAIAGGFALPNASTRALFALRQLQSLDDQKRGTLDALRYAASLGITTHLDQGGFPAAGTDADAAAHFDEYRAYDALLALHREGELINRIRLNFLHMEADPQTPHLRARLANVFPDFGGDLLKIVGIGEFTAGASPIIAAATPEWENGTRLVAEAGWRNENHSLTPADFKTIVDGWEKINAALPAPGITEQRWVLAHAPFITQEYVAKLKALGAGVSVLGGWRWLSGTRDRERATVPHAARQRHTARYELRRHADLTAEPVDRPVLRRDREECARRAHQRGSNARARRSGAPLHGRERLVLERGGPARQHRSRQVRGSCRAFRRLFRR